MQIETITPSELDRIALVRDARELIRQSEQLHLAGRITAARHAHHMAVLYNALESLSTPREPAFAASN